MTIDRQMVPSSEDTIDLLEVFAALRRRWRTVVVGGLFGLFLAAGTVVMHRDTKIKAGLIVDVAQGPCYLRNRQYKIFAQPFVVGLKCAGEIEPKRVALYSLAKQSHMIT